MTDRKGRKNVVSGIWMGLALAYAAWLAVGTRWIDQRASAIPSPRYVAARLLWKNHRLQAKDLVLRSDDAASAAQELPPKESYLGKYIATGIPKGSPVVLEYLTDSPAIDLEEKVRPVHIPPPLVGRLNAGSLVDICTRDECPATAIRVRAVVCADDVEHGCYAYVALPKKAASIPIESSDDNPVFILLRKR